MALKNWFKRKPRFTAPEWKRLYHLYTEHDIKRRDNWGGYSGFTPLHLAAVFFPEGQDNTGQAVVIIESSLGCLQVLAKHPPTDLIKHEVDCLRPVGMLIEYITNH